MIPMDTKNQVVLFVSSVEQLLTTHEPTLEE